MFFDDDNAVYLAEFGTAATVGGIACRGLFLESYQEAYGIVAGSSESLLVPTSVPADQGTAVVVNSASYVVRGVEPDGTGFKRLLLEVA